MSTPSLKLQDCAICEKKATSVCSKCKTTSFCSIECQKMLHPVHKFLCEKDPSSFFFPPLTTDERDLLLKTRSEAYDHVCGFCACIPEAKKSGATLIEHVNSLGLFDGTIEQYLDSITAGGELLPEPRLSACLVLARSTLFTQGLRQDGLKPYRKGYYANAIWNSLADSTAGLISCRQASDHFATPDSNPFERLSRFFHRFLLISTFFVSMKDKGSHYVVFFNLAVRRMRDEMPAIRSRITDVETLRRMDHLAAQYICFLSLSDLVRS